MEIVQIIRILEKRYKIRPWREKPFKVLISTILSQRTKDEVTIEASKRLFKIADSPKKILKLSKEKIAKIIYPVGFYKQKAKQIKKLCKVLLKKYGGKVPNSREELLKLPGVGDKTASCILSYGFGIPTIPVDTHLNRISKRLGIVPKSSTPEKTRKILEKLIPNKQKLLVNFLFIQFGKDICKPIKPKCKICPIKKYCKFKTSISLFL
jgi:endonuclease-3